jgi:hypothetical protein
MENTNAFHCQQLCKTTSVSKLPIKVLEKSYIVSSIRMIIDTTKERRRRVFANILHKKVPSAGVFVKEGRYVVNES